METEASRGVPLTVLKGVGPAVAQKLAAGGIHAMEDLLLLLPREYLDHRVFTPLVKLGETPRATTRGVIVRLRQPRSRGRRRLEVGLAPPGHKEPLLWCVWFRSAPLKSRYAKGQQVLALGGVRRYKGQLQMAHPELVPDPEGVLGGGVRARYPVVEGVAPRLLEKLCRQAAAQHSDQAADSVPLAVARAQGLSDLARALRSIHLVEDAPEDLELAQLSEGTHPAQRRLIFEELFSLQLIIAMRRGRWRSRRAHRCVASRADRQALTGLFPFELTRAQQRVIEELRGELGSSRPMHRLLQGDVGSGKSVVAFAAAHAALASGRQAALMVPTEVLANQHFLLMQRWCRKLGFRAALLTAATPRAERAALLALAGEGGPQLFIGTHALLSPCLALPDLALAIVDEQHRFGVVQRSRLRDSAPGLRLPHLLVMTATPIPRSMALSVYGDLDLSILDELPPGRRPPRTQLFQPEERPQAYRILRDELARGRQAFVVCPLVEESESVQSAAAVSSAAELEGTFADYRVGLVHGRMPARQRDEVMDAFRAGEVDLLVATTVIEVGIDIPNASVMVVEHAHRFGLAQLHQLRGRVGRGQAESSCLLLTAHEATPAAVERLEAMVRTHDGFEIAEQDLWIRGPGELYGRRQAGVPRLRFADLRRHLPILVQAREAAEALIGGDPELAAPQHQATRAAVLHRWVDVPLLEVEAG